MHSQRGVNDESKANPSPLSGELASPTFSVEDLSLLRYKDEEDSERARRAQARAQARVSGDYGDLELGSVPLLPAGHPDEHHDLDDSDSDFFDYEEQSEHRHNPSLSCTLAGFYSWLRGPVPPHVYHIKPWFPRWQAAPARLVERWAPRKGVKIALLVGGLIFWIAVFFASLQASVAGQEIPGYGKPVRLSCHHRLWYVLNLIEGLIKSSRMVGQKG